jgi:hypothetical protein
MLRDCWSPRAKSAVKAVHVIRKVLLRQAAITNHVNPF